jgi:hypothetical protein
MRASMRIPRGRVPPREVDPEPHCCEADDHGDVRPETLRVADDRVVDRPLGQEGDRDRDERVRECERQSEGAEASLEPPEPKQPAERRQQAEVGRIDVVHVPGHGE